MSAPQVRHPGHAHIGPIDYRPDSRFRGRPYTLLGVVVSNSFHAPRYRTRVEAQSALDRAALNPRYHWRVDRDGRLQSAYKDLQDAIQYLGALYCPEGWTIWDRQEARYYYPLREPAPEAIP